VISSSTSTDSCALRQVFACIRLSPFVIRKILSIGPSKECVNLACLCEPRLECVATQPDGPDVDHALLTRSCNTTLVYAEYPPCSTTSNAMGRLRACLSLISVFLLLQVQAKGQMSINLHIVRILTANSSCQSRYEGRFCLSNEAYEEHPHQSTSHRLDLHERYHDPIYFHYRTGSQYLIT